MDDAMLIINGCEDTVKTSGGHLRADSVHHRREGRRGRSDPAPSGAERSVGADSEGGGEPGLLRLPMRE